MPVETKPAPAPAPAAPAPAPSSAPAPAPAPAAPAPAPPSGGDSGPPSGSDANPFAEIDAAIQRVEGTPPPAAHATPEGGSKPPPAPAPSRTDGKPPAREPLQLRQEYEKLKTEHTSMQARATELENKIKEFETRGKDTQALTERLSALEKQLAEKDGELRMLKQEASPDFKAKWDKPFDQAADYAKSIVEQLTVEDPEGTRLAKWDDFVALYRMPVAKALSAARELFGENAPVVIQQMTELRKLEHSRNLALNEERQNAQARMKEEEGKIVQQREQFTQIYSNINKDLAEKVEDYHDAPDDKEAAEIRQKALALFDAPPQNMRENLVKAAHIRQRVAAFGPLKLKVARLTAQVKELEAKLAAADDTPGRTHRPGGAAPAGGDSMSWEEAARKEMS